MEPLPPRRDREEMIVHAAILAVGAIGVVIGVVARDFHGEFALALLFVVLGVRGTLTAS